MKKNIVLIIFSLLTVPAFSQLTAEQRIQDSVIGWWNDNYWDRNWKPQSVVLNPSAVLSGCQRAN